MTAARHQAPDAVVLDRIHHIAFVVADLDATIERMERILGVTVSERGCVPSRQAEVAIFNLANTRLEFVAPASAASPLHQHLAERGEGLFHIGFGVSDVDLACAQMNANGNSVVSEPYTGYKDWRIAYLAEPLPGGGRMHIIAADAD
ncbi:MAG: VOC family protein [Rhodanobacter sp.]